MTKKHSEKLIVKLITNQTNNTLNTRPSSDHSIIFKSGILMRNTFLKMLYGFAMIIFLGLDSCPLLGQVSNKKHLTETDYHLWHTMGNEQISENGNWVSYHLSYENSIDTTFVINTKTLNKFIFPKLNSGQFNGEIYSFVKDNDLVLFNLESSKEKIIAEVNRYEFSSDKKFLATLENFNILVIREKDKIIERIENISSYEWNYDRTKLVYATSVNNFATVGILNLNEKYSKHSVVKNKQQTLQTFKWQLNGNSFAFYGINKGNEEVYYFDIPSDKMSILKVSDNNFPRQMKIAPDQNIHLKVSRDGKKVFFGISNLIPRDTTELSDGIEVWNAKDQFLYRDRMLRESLSHPQSLAVWFPKDGFVRPITSVKQSWAALNGNQNYAIVADPYQYEPQYKWIADMDYYLMNLRTGVKELLLKEHSGYDEQMDFSPDGRYISYYKKNNWWIYDILKKSHTNITEDLGCNWDNRIDDPGTELHVFGQPGWTKDGKYILYYDYYDVWAITPDGKNRKRLTKGKELEFQFRLDNSAIVNIHEFNCSDTGTNIYDLSKPIVLTAYNLMNNAKGFYNLEPNKEAKPLVIENSANTKYKKASKSNDFIYNSQRFDNPQSIIFKQDEVKIVLAESNKQHSKYYWGKSEIINYKNSTGINLKGVLYYPADYDSNKKYPMVVFIYESLSSLVNDYVNPSLNNGIGFNITNLTTNGYAVLLPDISFEKGNTGISASDCVTAATKKVIDMGIADANKIGLTGQSFGGYETNFIITQTNMFATAISGAAVSDTMQHYFTINTDYNTIDGWRYENQQYRMGFSFFENQEAYYRNSPLQNASKINTPLLTWAGKTDGNVQPKQAEAFYAALRRLKKEHVMLVYENDGHIFHNPKNQVDLTHKTQEWFDYYLKGKAKADWMKADMEVN